MNSSLIHDIGVHASPAQLLLPSASIDIGPVALKTSAGPEIFAIAILSVLPSSRPV